MKEDKGLNHNLKVIAKTSFFGILTIILAKLFVYIYRVIIARYYGPEMYGMFSLAVMVSSLFAVFASFGLFEGLVRFISFYRGRKKQSHIAYLVSWSAKFLAFSGIIAGMIMFFLSETISVKIFHNSDLIILLKMFSICVPLSIFADSFLAVLRGYEMINLYSFISTVARNAIKVAFIALFIFIGLKPQAIPLSYMLGTLAAFIMAFWIYRIKVPKSGIKNLSFAERIRLKDEMLVYSLPLIFSTVIFMIFGWVDSFAIGYFKSALEVGLYNAAVPIAMAMAVAPDLFMRIFFPMITREYSRKNINTIRELSKQVSKWIFIVNLPALILLLIFPGAALNILFGKEYLAAENALRVLALAYFCSAGIGSISLRLVSMTGKSKLILYNNGIAVILNIILMIMLVPMEFILGFDNSNGLLGASISTLVSLIFMVCLFMIQSYRITKALPLRRMMAKIVIASVIPTAALLFFRSMIKINAYSLILLGIIFLAVYIITIIAINGLDRNDLLILNSIKSKISLLSSKR